MAQDSLLAEAESVLASLESSLSRIAASGEDVRSPSLLAERDDLAASLARLRGINSAAHNAVKHARETTTSSRDANDRLRLKLAALAYESRHLEHEIASCRDEPTIHESLPLVSLDDFLARHPDKKALPEQELMLARIADEADERRRIEDERKRLLAEKTTLAQENKVRQQELDALDAQYRHLLSAADTFERALRGH